MEITERVYTAKDRKQKGMFYGDPKNKKFPIADKEHYSLALQMLGRASYPGFNKSAVRARILSYGKKMGWTSDDSQAEEFAGACELIGAFLSESKEVNEANSAKTSGGKMLLRAIMHEANHIGNHATALHDYGSGYYNYGNKPDGNDPMDDCMESCGAMYESASRLKRMTKMMRDAEQIPNAEPPAAPPDGDTSVADGSYESEDIDYAENLILESDPIGKTVAIAFAESVSIQKPVKGEIKGTLIAPGMNKSKTRFYNPAALREAVKGKMWVGRHMFLDHATQAERQARPEGSVRNAAAIIRETWLDPDGSIGYRAQMLDPKFAEQLAYMQEHGTLGAFGVSIRAAGEGQQEKINGLSVYHVERFIEAYSADFVTLPGAYGSIDLLESMRDGSLVQNGENTMDEKQMESLKEALATMLDEKLKPISKSVREQNDRLVRVEAREAIAKLVDATELPEEAKTMVKESLVGDTDTSRVEAEVARYQKLVESLAPKKEEAQPSVHKVEESNRRVVKSAVEGMGAPKADANGGRTLKTMDDLLKSPAVAILGGKEKAEKLMETIR